MGGLLTVTVVLIGVTAGVSGAYAASGSLFPALSPLESISSFEERLTQSVLLEGTIQTVDKEYLILAIDRSYSMGDKTPLKLQLDKRTLLRGLVPRRSSSGTILSWEEKILSVDDIKGGLAALVSVLRKPGELRATAVTLHLLQ